MRLKESTIAGFHGFKLPKTIPLDADIVVIHGSNGSDKSSIVEALEWLLLGGISRHSVQVAEVNIETTTCAMF